MAARQYHRTRARTRGTDTELFHARMLAGLIDVSAEGRSEIGIVPGRVSDQIIPPIIKSAAMRIRKMVSHVCLELARARFKSINRGILISQRTGCRFHLRAVKHT